jgi:hypothetical protein
MDTLFEYNIYEEVRNISEWTGKTITSLEDFSKFNRAELALKSERLRSAAVEILSFIDAMNMLQVMVAGHEDHPIEIADVLEATNGPYAAILLDHDDAHDTFEDDRDDDDYEDDDGVDHHHHEDDERGRRSIENRVAQQHDGQLLADLGTMAFLNATDPENPRLAVLQQHHSDAVFAFIERVFSAGLLQAEIAATKNRMNPAAISGYRLDADGSIVLRINKLP